METSSARLGMDDFLADLSGNGASLEEDMMEGAVRCYRKVYTITYIQGIKAILAKMIDTKRHTKIEVVTFSFRGEIYDADVLTCISVRHYGSLEHLDFCANPARTP